MQRIFIHSCKEDKNFQVSTVAHHTLVSTVFQSGQTRRIVHLGSTSLSLMMMVFFFFNWCCYTECTLSILMLVGQKAAGSDFEQQNRIRGNALQPPVELTFCRWKCSEWKGKFQREQIDSPKYSVFLEISPQRGAIFHKNVSQKLTSPFRIHSTPYSVPAFGIISFSWLLFIQQAQGRTTGWLSFTCNFSPYWQLKTPKSYLIFPAAAAFHLQGKMPAPGHAIFHILKCEHYHGCAMTQFSHQYFMGEFICVTCGRRLWPQASKMVVGSSCALFSIGLLVSSKGSHFVHCFPTSLPHQGKDSLGKPRFPATPH